MELFISVPVITFFIRRRKFIVCFGKEIPLFPIHYGLTGIKHFERKPLRLTITSERNLM